MKYAKSIYALVIICSITILGCDNGNKKKLEEMKKQIDTLDMKVFGLMLKNDRYSSAELDPIEKGYVRADAQSGIFLIIIKDIKPYLDGYKIYLNIGNPMSCTYVGCKLNITYGKKFDDEKDKYIDWKASLREKSVSLTEKILPGYWNKAVITISPASPEELKYLEVKINTDQIELQQTYANYE